MFLFLLSLVTTSEEDEEEKEEEEDALPQSSFLVCHKEEDVKEGGL